MLSSLARRTGPLGAIVRAQSANSSVLAVRVQSTAAVAGGGEKKSRLQEQMDQWDFSNKIFYGPERDYKNFPTPRQLEEAPQVRLAFLPESWFHALYPKTGVSGPYVFLFGLATYLCSKEWFIVDHETPELVSGTLAFFLIRHKYGDRMKSWLERKRMVLRESAIDRADAQFYQQIEQSIQDMEEEVWFQVGQNYVFDAYQEQVDLMLEANYRGRLHAIYTETKRRLDYHVERESVARQFQQEHMARWIIQKVQQSITPEQEKSSITSCIKTLKALSTKAAVA